MHKGNRRCSRVVAAMIILPQAHKDRKCIAGQTAAPSVDRLDCQAPLIEKQEAFKAREIQDTPELKNLRKARAVSECKLAHFQRVWQARASHNPLDLMTAECLDS